MHSRLFLASVRAISMCVLEREFRMSLPRKFVTSRRNPFAGPNNSLNEFVSLTVLSACPCGVTGCTAEDVKPPKKHTYVAKAVMILCILSILSCIMYICVYNVVRCLGTLLQCAYEIIIDATLLFLCVVFAVLAS